MKELRVFIVTLSKEVPEPHVLGDEDFMSIAEKNGTVWSLEGFERAFNVNNEVDSSVDIIRFIEVEVPSDDTEVNITVNKLELASDLAHNAMCDELGVSIDDWEDNEEVISIVDGNRGYTENAQDIFNRWYDYFIHHIEATEV